MYAYTSCPARRATYAERGNTMKVLIVYYTQTGNTMKVAKAIARGARTVADQVDVVNVKKAKDYDPADYDLVGIGTPIWKTDTPNIRNWYHKLPNQNGKHCFAFATHGTLPHLCFPVMLPLLRRSGFTPIGYKRWYGSAVLPTTPWPYYTHGHPDEQDLAEAEAFGKEMVENSIRIHAGETDLIYPDPEMNDKVFSQAMICSHMLSEPFNPIGTMIRDPEKCLYPKCRLCVDNCTMDYNDFDAVPQRFGNRGFQCDDCHECSYCFLICPVGAIRIVPDIYEQAEKAKGYHNPGFEAMLDRDEKEGSFRRLIPKDQVGYDTPFIIAHPKHPHLRVPRDDEE